jgi:hydrogenase-4 transcriptional activator
VIEESVPAKILIVEDEALIAHEIRNRLTKMGWEVVGTAFGEEAVELARETRPDLLLCDIQLRHGLSGIDLSARIQAMMDIPIVFLTAFSDEDTVAKAKKVTPFGYIIKPVENRDLQITIEMALYKFRVEKELKEKQQLLETALACIGNALIFLDQEGKIININQDARELLGRDLDTGEVWRQVLGERSSVVGNVKSALRDKNLTKLPPFLMQRAPGTTKLVDGIVGPMEEGAVLILRDLGDIEDPVKLGATEIYDRLGSGQLSPSESSFCQVLISPDGATSAVLAEIVEDVRARLDSSMRATDLVSVFANSMVSISLPYTTVTAGEQIAFALLEQLNEYEHSGTPFTFSAGLAHSTGGDQEPIELFRRATSALDTARRSGGNHLWVDGGEPDIGSREMRGSQEYRHVVLLWNVMNALAAANDLDTMSDEFCRQLFHVFRTQRSALFSIADDKINLKVGYTHSRGKTSDILDLELNEHEFSAIKAISKGNWQHQQSSDTALFGIAGRWVLFLSGGEFNAEDQSFLSSLSTYFGSSISRFYVEPEPVEVLDVSEQQLVYDSAEMQHVLDTADLAAPTDVTVLLLGESGTGKEVVTRYIHKKGSRRDKPLVVVDCGAVAPSLIESELFGHVKGAFTGATSNFKGRLKEADGGTVLLDEVGELPLDTQVKLLRFVQDRQVAAVGSNQYETVDARVIAATNRDLKEMVDEGKFREDLYYRLNVFSIAIPPLRDRQTDILKVAQYYLQHFAAHYNKMVTGFTVDAEQALLDYAWPGNIRELSNVVNRAVILSKDQLITTIQVGVFGGLRELGESPRTTIGLRPILQAVVDVGISGSKPLAVGRHLEEDFILMSIKHHDGVLNRAALSIGVPESTLRRKVQKMESSYGSLDADRPDEWPVTPELYHEVMKMASQESAQPLDILSALLMSELQDRKLSRGVCAQLLGVSLPTYRRMAEEFADIF